MEVKIFTVELTGMVGQNLRKVEGEINLFLSTRDCISLTQSILQEPTAGRPRIIITVVAAKKSPAE